LTNATDALVLMKLEVTMNVEEEEVLAVGEVGAVGEAGEVLTMTEDLVIPVGAAEVGAPAVA
jgi:hypothetical protein